MIFGSKLLSSFTSTYAADRQAVVKLKIYNSGWIISARPILTFCGPSLGGDPLGTTDNITS